MKEILSDYNGWFFFALGLFPSVIGLIYWLIKRKGKRIVWEENTDTLVSSTMNGIKGLEISYEGKKVSELKSTRLDISNAGNASIKPDDFFSDGKPEICCTNGEILKFSVENDFKSFATNPKTTFVGELEILFCSSIELSFEFWKKKDTVSLLILHTGIIDFNADLPDGKVVPRSVRNKEMKNLLVSCAVCTCIAVGISLWAEFSIRNSFDFHLVAASIPIALVGFFFTLGVQQGSKQLVEIFFEKQKRRKEYPHEQKSSQARHRGQLENEQDARRNDGAH